MSVQLKEQGNDYFKKGDYNTAIVCYSKAIEITNSNPTYYLNRAKCYKILKQF